MHSTLGWEDLLEKETATNSSILACKIPWTEEPSGYSSWGHKELDPTEQLSSHAHPSSQLVANSHLSMKLFNSFLREGPV